MLSKSAENIVAKWLYIGVPAVSLLVTGFLNYDPVNIAKMVVTVGIGLSIFALIAKNGIKSFWLNQKIVFLALVAFILFGITSTFASSAPLEQNLFGIFGRNTGLLTYIGLAGILAGATLLRDVNNYSKITMGLLFAGFANVLICALELMGFNIFGFNNIYGNILGTFGNPNFISSFLGIFISALLAYAVGPGVSLWFRILSIPVIALAFFEILDSNSIQGIVVTVLGFAIVGYLLVRSYINSLAAQIVYILLSLTAGFFGIAGALQIGPLTRFIYKTSVSLRGEYWDAGLKMGMDHPFTGVGFDTYGDWYRRTRSASAMILPGPSTVTNSAHNVNIDIFAYGGFPLLLSYLTLIILATVSIIKVVKRPKHYDKVFFPLMTVWLCYQAQALISINQIGLAVWGWLLTGAVIGYEKISRATELGTPNGSSAPLSRKKQNKDEGTILYLTSVIGFAAGLVIALPPLLADSAWRSAIKQSSVEAVEKSATRWPIDSYRIANVAVLLEQNKFPDQAYGLAKELVQFNPEFFDSWKIIAGISKSSADEKKYAISKMRELDPRNRDLK